jgi:uncharacterized protein YciI
MPADGTPDFVIETVWVIEATYAPDAAETRVPFRAEHLARAARLKRMGVIVEVGGFVDVSGAILVVRAASEDDALAIAREDPYTREGVWVELRARQLGRLALVEDPGATPGAPASTAG